MSEEFKVPSFDLSGKVAVVTGGSKGLGYGMARTFAHYGANVAICSRSAEECKSAAEEISQATGKKVIGIVCDVDDNDQIKNMFDQVVKELGAVDICVANAGIASTNYAVNMTEDEFDDVIRTDLRAVFFTDQCAANIMINQGRGGRIINIASAGGVMGARGVASYCAAKGGVVNMSRGLALEWGRFNITVNALCPGYVLTDLNRLQLEIPKIRSGIENFTAFRRLGTIEEVATAALYLASDFAGYTTGTAFLVDGGAAAQ